MAPRTDRKLAAILAADVVGYSRLVGDDEAGTIARLRALRQELIEPLVAEYHGRVVKLMGDGALVEFASAVDAVECAVAIQKSITEHEAATPESRRIAFRIGIRPWTGSIGSPSGFSFRLAKQAPDCDSRSAGC
jgi:adenylate cyclase